MESKSELRRIYRKRRTALAPEQRLDVARSLVPQVRALAQDCRIVALTRSVGAELPTEPFARDLASQGVSLLWLEADPTLDPTRDAWSVETPDARTVEVPLSQVDLFLVPGLAFTLRGERLGQGGGFFDRLLARRRPGSLVVGLCFDCQLAQDLPTESHDQVMDHVLHG